MCVRTYVCVYVCVCVCVFSILLFKVLFCLFVGWLLLFFVVVFLSTLDCSFHLSSLHHFY